MIRALGEADQLDGDERRPALNALAEALNLPAPPPGWRAERLDVPLRDVRQAVEDLQEIAPAIEIGIAPTPRCSTARATATGI